MEIGKFYTCANVTYKDGEDFTKIKHDSKLVEIEEDSFRRGDTILLYLGYSIKVLGDSFSHICRYGHDYYYVFSKNSVERACTYTIKSFLFDGVVFIEISPQLDEQGNLVGVDCDIYEKTRTENN